MGPLTRASVRFALVSIVALFLVAAAGAAVRLLPWLLAPGVPFGVALPFARALAARALEVAVLIGMPAGFAIAAARFVERGEARALHALGTSPSRMVSTPASAAAALAIVYAIIGAAPYGSPGRFAAALVEEGRGSCSRATEKISVEVPLVGVTWLCFPPGRALVTGRVPGMSSGAWFTAANLSPNDDLTRLDLSELRVAFRGQHGMSALNVSAHRASISGLPPWGRPSTLRPLARAILVAATALITAIMVAYAVIRAALTSRLASAVAAGAAALFAVAVITMVDRADTPILYLTAPVCSGTAVRFLPWILVRMARSKRLSRILTRWSSAPLLTGPQGDRNPAANYPTDPRE